MLLLGTPKNDRFSLTNIVCNLEVEMAPIIIEKITDAEAKFFTENKNFKKRRGAFKIVFNNTQTKKDLKEKNLELKELPEEERENARMLL